MSSGTHRRTGRKHLIRRRGGQDRPTEILPSAAAAEAPSAGRHAGPPARPPDEPPHAPAHAAL